MIIIVIIIGVKSIQNNSGSQTIPNQVAGNYEARDPVINSEQSTQPKAAQANYTMAEIASANNETKCWTVVNGQVYDLTNFISRHPGGKANIMSICGKDGTAAFDNQHEGQARPENALSGLQIGILKQ